MPMRTADTLRREPREALSLVAAHYSQQMRVAEVLRIQHCGCMIWAMRFRAVSGSFLGQ